MVCGSAPHSPNKTLPAGQVSPWTTVCDWVKSRHGVKWIMFHMWPQHLSRWCPFCSVSLGQESLPFLQNLHCDYSELVSRALTSVRLSSTRPSSWQGIRVVLLWWGTQFGTLQLSTWLDKNVNTHSWLWKGRLCFSYEYPLVWDRTWRLVLMGWFISSLKRCFKMQHIISLLP